MTAATSILITMFIVFCLFIIHEFGHIIGATILKLRIKNFGFTTKPILHFQISVEWSREKWKRTIYLLSGFFAYLITLIIILLFEPNNKLIYLALSIQFIIETNPYYSDFVILMISTNAYKTQRTSKITYREAYKIEYQKYKFSRIWYFHFTLWALIILGIIKFNTLTL